MFTINQEGQIAIGTHLIAFLWLIIAVYKSCGAHSLLWYNISVKIRTFILRVYTLFC